LPIILYVTGKIASKIFREVYRNELNLLLVSLSFQEIPMFNYLEEAETA
jgi:hypothetical protein